MRDGRRRMADQRLVIGDSGSVGRCGGYLFRFRHAARPTPHALKLFACCRITQRDRQYLGLESSALAGVAELRAHEAFEAVPGELALALLVEPLEIGNDALKGAHDFARLARAPEGELNLSLARTPKQHALEILRERLIGSFHALLVMLRHAAQKALVIDHHALATAPPRQNRALFKRLLRVGHHQTLVEDQLLAQSMANRTRAGGCIEREVLGRERFVALAGRRTEIPVGMECLNPLRAVEG